VSANSIELGQSLCKFGRAQSKIASLQENFAINVKETFFDGGGLGKDMEKFKEYGVLRKKLDSRRCGCWEVARKKYSNWLFLRTGLRMMPP
jgi:hypothetical protein